MHKPSIAVSLAIVLVLAAMTWRQLGYWHDDFRLFSHTAAVTTDNWLAYCHLGSAFARHGDYAAAAEEFRKAIRIHPDADEEYNLGNYLIRDGKSESAIGHYLAALRLKPHHVEARYNLAIALVGAGDLPNAQRQFSIVLQSVPNSADAHCGLAMVLLKMDRCSEAMSQFSLALQLDPGMTRAREGVAACRKRLSGAPNGV